MTKASKLRERQTFHYNKFDSVDGRHPLQTACPDSFVKYKVRRRHGGRVAMFNFELAKEMGLIPEDHPHEITPELSQKILETFSLVIINEYDQINKIKYPEEDILPNYYMATRYLQLQHPDKKGLSSGDGRSIWNGVIKHKGQTWDISSCGTGATRLSPATSLKKKFFKTGDPSISYGCGYSEVDEGLAAYLFSEIFHRNNIPTERVLAIIEFNKGLSINVRAHSNLLRPSHLFRHLKQENYESLKNMMNYYIDRETFNQRMKDKSKKDHERWDHFLEHVARSFAEVSAIFEDEYIFCWLDWDGDNILMDGSIIDYGSVRQFGLFHHEYRYDDVQRFSTTITEQKCKARYTIQTFAQLIDYLKKKKKKKIKSFSKSRALKIFDEHFEVCKNRNILYKIGFPEKESEHLLLHHSRVVKNFRKVFSYFERAKSKDGIHKVADGINWSAIYCMRDILRELPQLYLSRGGEEIHSEEFIGILASNYATEIDLAYSAYRNKKIKEFQKLYLKMIKLACEASHCQPSEVLLNIITRSSAINKYDRVTGDSITTIVDKVRKRRPRLTAEELYRTAVEFTHYQDLNPEKEHKRDDRYLDNNKLLKGMFKIVKDYREGL